jgi:hypothetical protein
VVPLEDIFELVSIRAINGDQQGAVVEIKSNLPVQAMFSPTFSIQTSPPQIVRKESNPRGRRLKGAFSVFLSSELVEIKPGLNEFTLTAQVRLHLPFKLTNVANCHYHSQGSIHSGNLCQLSLMLNDKMDFVSAESKHGLIEVIEVEPKVTIESGQLLARLPQLILMRFTAGTKDIEEVCLSLAGF